MNFKKIAPCLMGLALLGATVSAASAEGMATHKGGYVAGGLGLGWLNDSDVTGTGVNESIDLDRGWVGSLAAGYALGNGVRIEGELAHRRNGVDSVTGTSASGDATTNSLMANFFYDFNLGKSFTPYIGLGAGLAVVRADGTTPIASSTLDDSDTVLAWQGIIGGAYELQDGLELTADYRYFQTSDPDFSLNSGTKVSGEYQSHALMMGLRWRFAAPKPVSRPRPAAAVAPEPMPAAQPMPAPMPVAQPKPKPAPRSFIVFFDWDKSNIRPDALRILEAAASYSKKEGLVRINLAGHADRSGTTRYNLGLSKRRAQAARAALRKLGLSTKDISMVGKGESSPLVPTADGVREPRNRRVEIVF